MNGEAQARLVLEVIGDFVIELFFYFGCMCDMNTVSQKLLKAHIRFGEQVLTQDVMCKGLKVSRKPSKLTSTTIFLCHIKS